MLKKNSIFVFKKVVPFIIVFLAFISCVFFGMSGISANAIIPQAPAGAGTEGSPYLISTPENLMWLAENYDNSAPLVNQNYKLTENIDLNNTEIGIIAGARANAFCGVFDGNGYTISNLKITSAGINGSSSCGLFGFINGGTVKNLNIFNINADLVDINQQNIGGIAGEVYNGAYIHNTTVSSSRLTGFRNIGGIAGVLDSSEITDCKVFSNYISSQINAGGIVGSATGAGNIITGCSTVYNNIFAESYKTIAGIDSVAAGIVASSRNTSVIECVSDGNVILSQKFTAGIAGVCYGTEIKYCYNTSAVTGRDGINYIGIASVNGADGIAGITGTDTKGVNGKTGYPGINGGNGGSAGGIVCVLDFNSFVSDTFNAGLITAGKGGNGGNGGNGGKGGDGGNGNPGGKGGNGGNGGVGGNGGNGGSAGAIYVYFINNNSNSADINNSFVNVYTRPDTVSLGAVNNSGYGGAGGAGGIKGNGRNGGSDGSAGSVGANGDAGLNGIIVTLKDNAQNNIENRTPVLHFDYNGGNQGVLSKDVEYNDAFGTLPDATKTKADFIGWNTESDGSGEYVYPTTIFLSLNNITVYAQYENIYEFNINLNYGSAPVNRMLAGSSQVYSAAGTPVNDSWEFKRDGWAFDGWYENSLCTIPLAQAKTAAQLGDGATIYAKWLREIKINFDITEMGTIINNEAPNALNNFNNTAGFNYIIRVSERPLGVLPAAEHPDATGQAPDYKRQIYFGGWYENLQNTSTLVAATTIYNYASLINGQITLSSRWNTNAFLEYNLMGGDGINECSAPWDGFGYENYAGAGTQQNPYQIANARQLYQLARDINGVNGTAVMNARKTGWFILTNNIDLGGHQWAPIGNGTGTGVNISRFEGRFNGNGFYIKNLNVSHTITSGTLNAKYFIGLFGAAYNAEISFVGIESGQLLLSIGGSAVFPSSTKIYIGSVMGYCAGSTVVNQCYNNATVTVEVNRNVNVNDVEAYVGGLIGRLDDGSYEGWGAVANGSTFTDSYNSGAIKSYFNYNQNKVYNFVGGIIGYVYRSDFANVFNTASVDIKTTSTNSNSSSTNSTVAFAGGICGEINSRGTLTNCFNTGSVKAECFATGSGGGDKRGEVGGIVAHLNNNVTGGAVITVNGCKNFGDLTLVTDSNSLSAGGGRDLGGIIGLIVGGTTSPAVTGSKNYYKANVAYFGICSYNNGSTKTTAASNGSPGALNGNHVQAGNINLTAYSSNDNYGAGVFEFTTTSYFKNTAYFNITAEGKTWNFDTIWEFRLDRNDNLPLLKYMSYLTEYNNGAVTPNRKYVYEDEHVGRLITPIRTDFIFAGWWNVPVEFDPALGGVAYNGVLAVDGALYDGINAFINYKGKLPSNTFGNDDSTIFKGVDNIQIYAAWLPDINPITVTLNNIAGAYEDNMWNVPARNTVSAFKNYEFGMLYTPYKKGYTFLGWYDAPVTGGTRYHSNTVYASGAGMTLYARWQANDYTLNFYPGAGFMSQTIFPVKYDSAVGTIPVPYLFGYTFLGWNINALGTGAFISSETIFNYVTNIDLFAIWQKNTYTVTFDNNTGSVVGTVSGSMSALSFDYGEGKALIPNGFSVNGYDFLGWALTPASSVVYTDGAIYTMASEGHKVLYARWQAKTYFVQIDAQGGAAANPDSLVIEGETNLTIPLPSVTKTGYKIDKWFVKGSQDVEIEPAVPGGSLYLYTIGTDNTVLYCTWSEPLIYSIAFNSNVAGDFQSMPDVTGKTILSTAFNLPNNAYIRTGYEFLGWSLTANDAVLFENAEQIIMSELLAAKGIFGGSQIVLYAVWNAKERLINFDGNGVSIGKTAAGSMDGQIFLFNVPGTIQPNQFAIFGYHVVGWTTIPGGTVAQYSINGSITIVDESFDTLYAVWAITEYKIEFYSGAGILPNRQSNPLWVFEGSNIDLSAYTAESLGFSRFRNTFAGWSFVSGAVNGFMSIQNLTETGLNPDAPDVIYVSDSDTVIKLYAIWTPEVFNLKIIYEGASIDPLIISGIKYGVQTSYNREDFDIRRSEGFKFMGFFAGNTRVAGADGVVTINELYFKDVLPDDPHTLVLTAKYEAMPIIMSQTDISSLTLRYKETAELSVWAKYLNYTHLIVPGQLVFSIDPASVSGGTAAITDVSQGKIIVTPFGMGKVAFTVKAVHANGAEYSFEFNLTVKKRILTISNYDSDFTYNGLIQNVNYALYNIAESDMDLIRTTLVFEPGAIFRNSGTYYVAVTLIGEWADYYEFDENADLTLVIKKKTLLVTGESYTKNYWEENPQSFLSKFSGFVNGESAESLNILINYSTPCTQASKAGNYIIRQSAGELENYDIIFIDGAIEVKPVKLTGATFTLRVDDAGYTEGSKLYFDTSDIDFGAEGSFSSADYRIIWEWAESIDGTWTVLEGENGNQLLLSKYKLGMDINNRYFRARIIGQGNIDSSFDITSAVGADGKILPAPAVTPFTVSVMITMITLAAFAVTVLLVIFIGVIRNRILIKRIKRQ